MSYASGGLIQATDYNALGWGGTQGTYVSSPNNIAYVMGIGDGAFGYGQDLSLINTVAATNNVTATQWAGLLHLLNRALGHQSGSAALLSPVGSANINMTAGQTITYFANVAAAVTTINTNKDLFNAQGSVTTGADIATALSSTTGINSYFDRTVTFASAQHARYFFNAGGQLNLTLTTTGSNGSGSSSCIARLMSGLGGINAFRNTTNAGRTGTGYTLNSTNFNLGYRTMALNSPATIVQITDTTASYTAAYAGIQVFTSSNDTTSGANGTNVIFRTYYFVPDKTWDDTISINAVARIDIVNPETTYLTNSWGSPVVS